MHGYGVFQGVSFSLIDGRPVFLDLDGDRYFRIRPADEADLLARLKHIDGRRMCIDAPTRSAESAHPASRYDYALVPWTGPDESALECHHQTSVGHGLVPEVFAMVVLTRLQLRLLGMRKTLERVFGKVSSCPTSTSSCPSTTVAAQAFLAARRYVPIERRCLLDSIALARFLRRRRLSANLVFGVTADPFTAHCWLQAGNTLLNDAIGNIRPYSVIRVL